MLLLLLLLNNLSVHKTFFQNCVFVGSTVSHSALAFLLTNAALVLSVWEMLHLVSANHIKNCRLKQKKAFLSHTDSCFHACGESEREREEERKRFSFISSDISVFFKWIVHMYGGIFWTIYIPSLNLKKISHVSLTFKACMAKENKKTVVLCS